MATDENTRELSEGELEEGELLSSDEEESSVDKQSPPAVPSSQQTPQSDDQHKCNSHQKEQSQQQQQWVPNNKHKQIDKQDNNNKLQTSTKLSPTKPDSDDGEIYSDDEEAAYYPERVKSRSSNKKLSSPDKRPPSDIDNKTSDRESSQSREKHGSKDREESLKSRHRHRSRDRESWQTSPGGSESSRDDKESSSLFFEDREGKSSDDDQDGGREKNRRPWDSRDRNRDRHYSSPSSKYGRQDVHRDRSDDANRNNRDSSNYSRSGGYGGRKGGYTRQRPYGIKTSRFSSSYDQSHTPSPSNTGVTSQQFHLLADKVASRRNQGLPLLPTPSRKPKFSNLDQFNYPAAPSWYLEAVEEWEVTKKEKEVEPVSVIPTEGVNTTAIPLSTMATAVSSSQDDHKEAEHITQESKECVKPKPLMNIVTNIPPTIIANTDDMEVSKLQDASVAGGSVNTDHVISEAPPTIVQPKIKPLFEMTAESNISTLVQPVVHKEQLYNVSIESAPPLAPLPAAPASAPPSAQADQEATTVEAMDTHEAPPPSSLIVTSQGVDNISPPLSPTKQPTSIQDSDKHMDEQATPTTPTALLIITNDTPTEVAALPQTNPGEVEPSSYKLRPRNSSASTKLPSTEQTNFRPKISSDSDNEVSYEDYLDQLDQEEEEEEEDDINDDVIPPVFNYPISGVFPLAGSVVDSSSDQKTSISDLVSGTNNEEDDPFSEDFPAISGKKNEPSDQQSLLSLMGHVKQTEEVDEISSKARTKSGRVLHKKSVWKAKQQEREKQKKQVLAEKAKTVCKYFLNGSCKNGENCQYKHAMDAVQQQKKKEICKFYLQDSCTKGDTCNYYHGDFPCKFYHSKSHCKNGSQCKFSHAPLTPLTRELLASVLDQPLSEHHHPSSTLQQIIPVHSAPGGDFKIPMLKSGKAMTTPELTPDNKKLLISIPKRIASVDDSLVVSIPLSKLPLGRFKYGGVTDSQASKLGSGNQVPSLFANQPAPVPHPPVPPMPLPPQSQPIPLFPAKIDPSIIDQPLPVVAPPPAGLPPKKVLLPTPPPHSRITPQEFMMMKPVEYWETPELSQQQQQQQLPAQQFPPFVDNATPPSQRNASTSFQSWSNPPVNQPPPFQGPPPYSSQPPVPQQWQQPVHEAASNGMERPGLGMGQGVAPGVGMGQQNLAGIDDPRYIRPDPRRGVVTDQRRFDHEPMVPPTSVDQVPRPPWRGSAVSPPPPSTHHYHHTPPPSQHTGISNFKPDPTRRPGSMVRPDPTSSLPSLSHGVPPLSDPSRMPPGGHMSPPQQFSSHNVSPVWGKSPEHSTSNVGGASGDHVRRVDPRRKYSNFKIKSKGETSSQQSSSSILKRGGGGGADESSGFKVPKLLQNPSTLEKPLDPHDLFGGKEGDTQEYGDYRAPFGTFKSSFFSQQSQDSTTSSSQESEPSSSQKFGEITLDQTDKAKAVSSASSSDENLEEKSVDETASTNVPPKNQVPSYFAHLDVGLDNDLKIDSAFGSLPEEGGKTGSDGEEVKVQDSQARKLPSIFGMGL